MFATARARRFRIPGVALIAAAALGPLLLGNAVYAWLSVHEAGAAVLNGEASGWRRTMQARLRELDEPPTEKTLAALLKELQPDGLTALTFVSRGQRIEVGTPSHSSGTDEPRFGKIAVVFVGLGRGRPWAERTSPGFERPRSPAPRDRRFAGPGHVIVEFAPRQWPQLMSAARRLLVFGSATAAVVIMLSVLAWQVLRRQRTMEQEAMRARHLASLGEMSAALAHEIRNPLASLKGHAQLLDEALDAPGMETTRAKANRIVAEAVRLERITNDLLDFVRQGELERVEVDLGTLLRETAGDILKPDRLRLAIPAKPVVMNVDSGRLRQVIDNVIRNAAQAADDVVEVALAEEENTVVLTVRDHGAGIASGQEERIFEPFFTTRTRGTGLGLSIARRIVDLHGGTLTAGNHAEGGALFRLTLPRG